MRTFQKRLGVTGTAFISVPNLLSFMFSPQVVQVEGLEAGDEVTVTATNTDTGESIAETKSYYREALQFEMGRIIQILSELEPKKALSRIDYSGATKNGFLQGYDLKVELKGYEANALTVTVFLLPGALDGGETYGIGRKTTRLFTRYPQSLNVWTSGSECAEVPALNWLRTNLPPDAARLIEGETVTVPFPVAYQIQDDGVIKAQMTDRPLTLKPDTRKDGVYLRWLGRNGEAEYWLFTPGKKSTSVAVRNSFTRFEGDPAEPKDGVLGNSDYQDYTETRAITVGSGDVTLEEFETLCGLATSPVVEMLIRNEPGNYLWQRVNVAAGSYERNIRRSTPGLQSFEITINLPKRNTIQL